MESLLMQLELNFALLEKFLKQLEAKPIKAVFWQLVYRRSKAAAAVPLVRLTEELTHVKLGSLGDYWA